MTVPKYSARKKMRIISIDSKRFYGKELNEQNLVVLFKRPLDANDSVCEKYIRDILDVVKHNGDNLFSSDIISRTNWDNGTKAIIGDFFYLRKGENVVVSEGFNCVPGNLNDELYIDNTQIAKIQTKKQAKIPKILIVFVAFVFILVLLWFAPFSHEGMAVDTDGLKTTNIEPVLMPNSNKKQSNTNERLSLVQDQNNLIEEDDFSNDNYDDESSNSVNDSKTMRKEDERFDNHEKTYGKSESVVEEDDFYHRKGQKDEIRMHNGEDQKFNNLVSEADKYFRKYYDDGDESAARYAIKKYDEALGIKNNPMVSKRRKMLDEEIKNNE